MGGSPALDAYPMPPAATTPDAAAGASAESDAEAEVEAGLDVEGEDARLHVVRDHPSRLVACCATSASVRTLRIVYTEPRMRYDSHCRCCRRCRHDF